MAKSGYDLSFEAYKTFIKTNSEARNKLETDDCQTEMEFQVELYRNHLARWLDLTSDERVQLCKRLGYDKFR